jgi:hypothetical protein
MQERKWQSRLLTAMDTQNPRGTSPGRLTFPLPVRKQFWRHASVPFHLYPNNKKAEMPPTYLIYAFTFQIIL